MAEKFIAKVAVDNIVYKLDKLYDYVVPDEMLEEIRPGSRVLVPFGLGNKKRQGVVLQTAFTSEINNIKSIFTVLDQVPLLNDEMLRLIYFMKEKYFCTFFDVVKLILPIGMNFKLYEQYKFCDAIEISLLPFSITPEEKDFILYLKNVNTYVSKQNLINKFGTGVIKFLDELVNKNIIEKKELRKRVTNDAALKMVKLCEGAEVTSMELTSKQKIVYDILKEKTEGVSLKELLYLTGVGATVVDNLVKKSVARYFMTEVYRDPYKNVSFSAESTEVRLTHEQMSAYNQLKSLYQSDKYTVSLLYGVTGSGKTSVFLRLIDDVVKDGKNVIIMVPEIALTPQMIAIFKSKFLDKVAVFHSALSQAERLDEYKRVKSGSVKVVVGTRSAVFAPLENIGLIVLDEEQEYSYKSDATPRYHARDIAKFRCCYHKCLLLLASATPSVESFFLAKNNRYNIATLKNRYTGSELPKVTIVDMNKEVENGNISIFSKELFEKIVQNLEEKKQSILLLNRRGYNTFVSCRVCEKVVSCPNCSISLTYHSANKRLMCHYCGFSISATDECPSCHEHQLKYIGFGTQKIEEDLKIKLPQASVLRMDTDVMTSKFSYDEKLSNFAKGNYDIMLGTQMVAKGLNFPNVTLVGVLSADQSLYSEDFRSFERTFSLLTQVVGRSGRFKEKGNAIIQTFTPENNIIKLAALQDYESFYNSEIKMREALLYPPYANICVIGFTCEKEIKASMAAGIFFKLLKEKVKSHYSSLPLRVLGPAPAQVVKINNKYRYKIIVKFKDEKAFRELIKTLLIEFSEYKEYSKVTTFVDINPDVIL